MALSLFFLLPELVDGVAGATVDVDDGGGGGGAI